MTKQDFIQLLKLRLGNRQDSDFDSIIELEATEAQSKQIEENGLFVPFFLESDFVELSASAETETVALPTDFIGEIEDQMLQILGSDGKWRELNKARYDEISAAYVDEAYGQPVVYALGFESISLRPVPDQAYTLRFKYYAKDIPFNTLPATDENRILKYASDWLMAATGRVIAAEHLHDDGLMQKFDIQLAEAKTRVVTLQESREHSNRVYRMEPK